MKRMSPSDILRLSPTIETPSGLTVPQSSFDSLVKAEARKMADQQSRNWPRLFSKHMTAQNMIAYGAREKPVGTPSFDLLQQAARRSFVDAILIRARIDQFKMIWERALSDKDIGFKVVHDRHKDPDFEITEEIQRRCREMEELVANPTPSEYLHLYPHGVHIHESGIKDFISRVVRAELVIDRKVLCRYKRRNGKGYAAFHWLPGETIRPVHEGVREWAQKHQAMDDETRRMGRISTRLMDKASQATGWDLARAAYVQLLDGEINAAFSHDEVSIHIANPSDEVNRWGYGESRLEISLDLTATLGMAWTYNRELFNTNYPEQIVSVSGAYDKDGFEDFKKMIYQQAGGPDKSHRLPMVAGEDGFEVKAFKLRDAPKDMLFDQFFRMMIALKCAAYGAHPTIINFSQDSNGSQGGLFGHNPSDEIEFSKEHGLKPGLADMCQWLTNAIVKPTYPDLRMILVGIEEEDEKLQQELNLNRVKTYKTRNQARIEDGEEPIGDTKDPDNPWNYPADSPMASYLTAIASKKQLEAGGEEEEAAEPDAEEEEYGEGPDGEPEIAEPEPPEDKVEEALGKSESGRRERYLVIELDED